MNAIEERTPVTCNTPAGRFGLTGGSPRMAHVHNLISKALHAPVAVLLRGEPGTGKASAARAIHENGGRRHRAFATQNCTGVSEAVLECRLFGTGTQAFASHPHAHRGLFELADGGTLFLEEIGDMPASIQARLMNVLHEGGIPRYGMAKAHKLDIRVIAATCQDLAGKVAEGSFREDLFYRLSHFPIDLPPLRSRGLDILELARAIAIKTSHTSHQKTCSWSEAAIIQLQSYPFPGNIPELEALVERAVLVCEGGELLPEHFAYPAGFSTPRPRTLREQMDEVERELLLDGLRRNRGNRTRTACELGIARRTLLYRMERLQICRPLPQKTVESCNEQ